MEKTFSIGLIDDHALVGDALLTFYPLRALRAAYPKARIVWISTCEKTVFAGPIKNLATPLVDEVLARPTWLPTADRPTPEEKAPFFDLLIDLRNVACEALRARWRLPHGKFFALALRCFLSDRWLPFGTERPAHITERFYQVFQLAYGAPLPSVSRFMDLPPALSETARSALPDGKTYVGFVPGAGGKNKIWPLSRFIEVAAALAAKGATPVFILGPAELAWQAEIQAALPTVLFPLQNREAWGNGPMRIEETIAVGQRLKFAVTNDCGTSHMLGAVDCPLVSLFGPTRPAKFAPPVTRRRILWAQDFGDRAMTTLSVPTVLEAAESLWKEV